MNAKKSYFNKTIFLKNITQFWPVMACYTIFLLLMFPGGVWNTHHLYCYRYQSTSNEILFQLSAYIVKHISSCFEIVLTGGIAMIFAGIVFHYLFSNKSSGTIHSLPVSRTSLFFSNTLSGLTMLLVPQLLTGLITQIVLTTLDCGKCTTVLPSFAILIGYSFFFYAFAVLCCHLVGQIIALPVLFGFFNCFILFSEVIVRELMSYLLFGFAKTGIRVVTDIFTPSFYLYRHLSNGSDTYSSKGITGVIIYACVGVVFLAISLLLYKHRKMEHCGDPIAFRQIQRVIKVITTFFSAMVLLAFLRTFYSIDYSANSGLIIFIIFIPALILFNFVLEMLLQKTIHVFRHGLKSSIFYAAAAFLLLASINFDLFGYEKNIPDASKVDSIVIESTYSSNSDLNLEDEAMIKQAVALHKKIVSSRDSIRSSLNEIDSLPYYSTDGDYSYGFTIRYHLKNDKTIVRSYILPVHISADKYKNSVASDLEAIMTNQTLLEKTIKDLTTTEKLTTLSVYSMETSVDSINDDIASEDKEYSDSAVQRDMHDYSGANARIVFDAIKKDISNGNIVFETGLTTTSFNKENRSYKYQIIAGFGKTNSSFLFLLCNDKCENLENVMKNVPSDNEN